MDISTGRSQVAVVARGGVLLLLLVSAVLPLPVPNSSPQEAAPHPGDSHVMFYLGMQQLMERVSGLAEMAKDLLVSKCRDETEIYEASADPCSLQHTAQLENIEGLGPIPSPKVLEKEHSPTFLKHLLKDAYRNLLRLETVSTNEVSDGDSFFVDFASKLGEVRQQLKDTISSYLHARFGEQVRGMKKRKKIYLRQNHTKREYSRRLLYTAWDMLKRLKSVLQYAVELSWRSQDGGFRPA